MKTADIILQKLKRDGSITAKQLADDLSMTSMGARQHLQALQDSGLLEFFDLKVKVGRPTRHWQLTSQGHAQFADRHSDLTVQFIDAIETVFGQDGITKVLLEREAQTRQRYLDGMKDATNGISTYTSTTLEEKLKRLAQLRDEDGYMTELTKTDTGFVLVENHCPICKAAQSCPSLCQSELDIFQSLLGEHCSITRTEHIINDERRCVYQITEHNEC